MSNPYANVQKGKLNLKRSPLPSLGPQKKIKKKKRSQALIKAPQLTGDDDAQIETPVDQEEDIDTRTPAERRYEESLAKREKDRIGKMAQKSHRERIEEFNQKLTNMSEHYDIPKVGPG
jgi:protein FAM32A